MSEEYNPLLDTSMLDECVEGFVARFKINGKWKDVKLLSHRGECETKAGEFQGREVWEVYLGRFLDMIFEGGAA